MNSAYSFKSNISKWSSIRSTESKPFKFINIIRVARILVIVFVPFCVVGQKVTNDSLTKQINKEFTALKLINEKQWQITNDSLLSNINDKTKALKIDKAIAAVITFLPIALFLFIFISTLIKLKKDNVKLSDFLIDKDTQVAIKKEEANVATANARVIEAKTNAIKTNPQAFSNANLTLEAPDPPSPANQQEDPKSDKKEQSTSRLVAFISGITSVALAACITTFYFYRSFLGDTNVSIGNLATVLYGLGLGVLPYGFNKIANALK